MWVKRATGYYMMNPKFLGDDWVITCDDLDGTEMTILANRRPSDKTVLRNIRKIIRDNKIPVTIIGGPTGHVRRDLGIVDQEGGRIQKVAIVKMDWLHGDMPTDITMWCSITLKGCPSRAVNEQ